MRTGERIAEVLGREGYARLVAHYGGLRIWVTKLPSEALIGVLGETGADLLCKYFGGDYLHVPSVVEGPNKSRQIAELHRQGIYSINEIAVLAGCSRRTVFRHLAAKIS